MRNIKAIALLVLALVTGLAAAVYAAGWVAQRGGIAATKVVVAAVDIELGSRINPQMLTQLDWPSGSVPLGAFHEPRQLQDRVARVGIARGEALLERKLAPPGTSGGLSAVIADGKRAMTVRVNEVVGVAGFALPGNYVDVMVNTQQDRGRGEGPNPVSLTVLEKVLVLAIAQEASRDEMKPKVVSAVTLEVAPEEAEKLDLARSVGTLSLVLRNQLDKRPVATTGVTRSELLRLKEATVPVVAVAARAPRPPAVRHAEIRGPAPLANAPCVEVIRNGTRALNCF